MRRALPVFLAAWGLALPFFSSAAEPDLILRSGKIFLGPGRFASAVAVERGRIAAVGDDETVSRLKGKGTRVIDLRGRTVVPGFHDAHVHFMKGALFLGQLDLNGCTSVGQVLERLRDYAAKNPSLPWIIGRGWDHTAFPGGRLPARSDLDAVLPDRPVVLIHVDGHIGWINGEALRQAGITRVTPDPAHGKILRDASGEASGLIQLEDSALETLRSIVPVPEPSPAELEEALKAGLAQARGFGVTSIQGSLDVLPRKQLEAWRRLQAQGRVSLRYFLWGRLDHASEFADLRKEFSDLPSDRFLFGGLKGFIDGVLSARTGALLAPYSDDAKSSGESVLSQNRLDDLVRASLRAGWQTELHAVGDRAVRMGLDACAAAGSASAALPGGASPCKIEHIEVVDPADLPRFKELGAAASMQPSHMTYDIESQNYNPERLGARIRRAFAWRSFEKAGALLAFGTDWPIMPLDPRVALFAATTRSHFNGKPEEGWIPQEKVALEDAVVHYTLDPARAIGRAGELGSIEAGKLADLVVFEKDLFSVSGLDLLKIGIDLTIFDGKVVYERAP